MDQFCTTTSWEDMQFDCLSLIFSKLSLFDLATSIPFVCKSWSQLSSLPFFYKVLDFRHLDLNPSSPSSKLFSSQYSIPRFTFSAFLKLAIKRSKGAAFELQFSSHFPPSIDVLSLASLTCPNLKSLRLPRINSDDQNLFLSLVSKWRDLEWLEIESKPSPFRSLVEQIGIHCNRFKGIKVRGFMRMEDVSGIVDFLPKIEVLDLSGSWIGKEEVLALIEGCKDLKRLILKDCFGFEADDEVKLRAKRIQIFEFEGCSKDEDDDLTNFLDQADVLAQMFMYFGDCFEMWML